MRMSQFFLRTLRDDPSDAEVDSYRLLVRAGCIRKVAAGLYTWLPLGLKVLRKVEAIVREEMDASGAQELLLPIAQPIELWERTGRDKAYGPLMFQVTDRKESRFALAPTAEEAICATVAGELSSYRDLPVNLYQIQWKYRDELRPRFGLLRAREFLMKDAYSFHADSDDLRATYQEMYEAYHRIFRRCGLTFRPVEALAGEIGGDVNHEFMAIAAVGEDDFVWCTSCDYAANTEAALRRLPDAIPPAPIAESNPDVALAQEVLTPGLTSVSEVSAHLAVEPRALLKSLVFAVEGADEFILVLIPGDRELNTHALAKALTPRRVRAFDEDDFDAHPDVLKGFLGPHHQGASLVIADETVIEQSEWIVGANKVDKHLRGAIAGRDFVVTMRSNLVQVAAGDCCARCGSPLEISRGIEVGHTFQLGTKYSQALNARYTDASGTENPMVMGCYGIGISRIVAAVVEEHHDDAGINWPRAVAPYGVHLLSLAGAGKNAAEVSEAADRLYADLLASGVEVLFDDRAVSPGVKFADADLLGIPIQLIVGAKGIARGIVERKVRSSGDRDELQIADVVRSIGP